MDGVPARAKRGRAWLFASVLLLLASCRSSPERQAPTFEAEIEAQNRHLEEQFRAGNLLGVADVFADDGVLIDGRGVRTAGREEIDAFWSAIESPVDWRIEIRAIRGSDALAYELATSRLTTRRDGTVATTVSDVLILWRREPDGAWRIALDAFWPRKR
jgi:uncharacterized protein (TIGR02246 family)